MKKKKIEKYLDKTGIGAAFWIIVAEILEKNIDEQDIFPYTIKWLKKMNEEIQYNDHN